MPLHEDILKLNLLCIPLMTPLLTNAFEVSFECGVLHVKGPFFKREPINVIGGAFFELFPLPACLFAGFESVAYSLKIIRFSLTVIMAKARGV